MRRDEQNDLRPTSFGQQIVQPSRIQAGPPVYKAMHRHRGTGQKAVGFGGRECGSSTQNETDRANSSRCDFIS